MKRPSARHWFQHSLSDVNHVPVVLVFYYIQRVSEGAEALARIYVRHTGKVPWHCFRIEFVNIGAPWSLFKHQHQHQHQGPAGTLRIILAHLHSSGNSVTRQSLVEDIRYCAILARYPLISRQLWKRVRKTYLTFEIATRYAKVRYCRRACRHLCCLSQDGPSGHAIE